ncbi:hypothetical protein CHS0354_019587 [Potamilus streckersoni]|uniref:Uncharacterized protein n=1 Tax=Potamilus streckersoni TaxID=2493646 RepID=A0AAE0TGK8_9BIVA|nr:hypothetical protein CHS0354_019587 [Potamilus streckersoni]
MEETDPEELRILFRENQNLQLLNLSGNGFTRLHSDIFKTNTKLEKLDFSENFLLYTDWLSSTLMHLCSLNLKESRIFTIDSRTRQVIDNLVHRYNYSVGDVDRIHLNLANNPISCGCDQEEFARSRWCEFEAEIALYERKPIILVTLGDVKIRSLPSSLRKVCFKCTSLEWPGADNQDKLEDFWGKLIKAIIKFTADIRY